MLVAPFPILPESCMDARPQGLDRARNIMHQSRRGARCARLARWRRNPARAHRRVEEIRDERLLPPLADEHAEVNERGEGEEKTRAPLHVAIQCFRSAIGSKPTAIARRSPRSGLFRNCLPFVFNEWQTGRAASATASRRAGRGERARRGREEAANAISRGGG